MPVAPGDWLAVGDGDSDGDGDIVLPIRCFAPCFAALLCHRTATRNAACFLPERAQENARGDTDTDKDEYADQSNGCFHTN